MITLKDSYRKAHRKSLPQCLKFEANISDFTASQFVHYVNFLYGVGQFENNFPLLWQINGTDALKIGHRWYYDRSKMPQKWG